MGKRFFEELAGDIGAFHQVAPSHVAVRLREPDVIAEFVEQLDVLPGQLTWALVVRMPGSELGSNAKDVRARSAQLTFRPHVENTVEELARLGQMAARAHELLETDGHGRRSFERLLLARPLHSCPDVRQLLVKPVEPTVPV